MTIVGLPDTAVQESCERVQATVKNAGLIFPRQRVTVNLPPVVLARESSFVRMYVSAVDTAKAALIPDLEVIPVESLTTLVKHLSGVIQVASFERPRVEDSIEDDGADFREIKGHEHVKRALEVAAARWQSVLINLDSTTKCNNGRMIEEYLIW